MRIRTKLTIAFLIVGIIPMVTAVYLSIFYINENLLNEGQSQLKYAQEVVDSLEGQLFARTSLVSRLLATDKEIQDYLAAMNIRAVWQEMQERGDKLKESDQKVNEIELLFPSELYQYVSDSAALVNSTNPIWQGYSIVTNAIGNPGLLGCSVYKIEKEGKLLGGFKVGIWAKEFIIEQAPPLVPSVQVSLLPSEFKIPDNDPESTRLYSLVYKQGIPFSSERIMVQKIPFQAHCRPLKGLHNKIVGAIFIGSPRSTVSEVWNEYRNQIYFLMVGVATGLAIILGFIIAQGISHPIRKLVRGVNQIAQGNLNYRIRVRSRDELRELADSFNQMTDKLKETKELETQLHRQDKLASLGQLSAGIAHEIRNPLGIMKTSAGILKDKFPENSKEREAVKYIIDEVNRLNTFITDFLNFAKPREPRIIPTLVEEVLERTVKLAQTQYPPEKYPMEIIPIQKNGKIAVDPQQIQQVFLNLIINACQSMPDGGRLRIICRYNQDKKSYEIIFEDKGKGMTVEEINKIFDPFFTTRDDGTGLGLSVVNQIIEQHKGSIEVKSDPGKGTRFSVYLPIAG